MGGERGEGEGGSRGGWAEPWPLFLPSGPCIGVPQSKDPSSTLFPPQGPALMPLLLIQ